MQSDAIPLTVLPLTGAGFGNKELEINFWWPNCCFALTNTTNVFVVWLVNNRIWLLGDSAPDDVKTPQ